MADVGAARRQTRGSERRVEPWHNAERRSLGGKLGGRRTAKPKERPMMSMDKLRPLLTATLLAGSISALGVAGAMAAAPTQNCGTITQYIPATPLSTGLLTIGGQTYTIGSGAAPTGNLSVGANPCVATPQNQQAQ